MVNLNEIWLPVVDNKNYEVSNTGKVRNKNKKILYQGNNRSGYKNVSLYGYNSSSNGRKVKYVHRLVAEAFIPNMYNKPEVNHKDGNKKNNSANNLEWCTRSENEKHARLIELKIITDVQKENAFNLLNKINLDPVLREKRIKKSIEAHKNKSKNEYIIESSNQIKPLYCEELNRIFLSSSRVEDKLGIKSNTILKAINKNYSTCGGYHWRRIDKHRFNNYGN